jgi:hypothetical protein
VKLIAIPIVLAILGGALMAIYPGEPRMLSQEWSKGVDDFDLAAWSNAYQQNVTPSARIHGFGGGLLSMSLSVLALLWVTGATAVERLRSATTPTARWVPYALGNIAWVGLAASHWQLFSRQIERGQFSPVTEPIGFGFAGIIIMYGAALLPINVGLAIFLGRASLPAPLWSKPTAAWSWILNAIFVVLVVAWAAIAAFFFWEGEWPAGPALVVIAYTLLIGRAAASAG